MSKIAFLITCEEKRVGVADVKQHPALWYLPFDNKLDCVLATHVPSDASYIIVTSNTGLRLAESQGFQGVVRTKQSIAYGNMYGCSGLNSRGQRIICLPTIPEIRADRITKFLTARWLERIYAPHKFYNVGDLAHVHALYTGQLSLAEMLISGEYVNESGSKFVPVLMSIDLETLQQVWYNTPDDPRWRKMSAVIDSIGFCVAGYYQSEFSNGVPNHYQYYSFTMDYSIEMAEWCSEWFNKLPVVMSNGMYDMQYLIRWHIPCTTYLHDTEYFLRATAPELEGYFSLQSQATLYLRDVAYWKDGREAQTRREALLYNARDVHNTAAIAVAQLAALSKYTFRNFVIGFARVPYCLFSSLTGMEIDLDARAAYERQYVEALTEAEAKCELIFGCNANQSKALLPYFAGLAQIAKACGTKDVPTVDGTGKFITRDLSTVHPLYEVLLKPISDSRRYSKWLSTYIHMKTWKHTDNGMLPDECDATVEYMLWTLKPFGAKTGRMSSDASAFWVGMSAHTFPAEMRNMLKPPKGYLFCASDAPQSESRVSAHEAICPALKHNTESGKDFHSLNAEAFFGIPYDKIYDDATGKTLNKPIRTLAKPVNHGSTYNMGATTLVQTMGAGMVRKAQHLLNLPKDWTLRQVAAHLLRQFARSYPEIKTSWYTRLVTQVITEGRVFCQVSGYAPLMLGNPIDHKPDLNSVVATVPQSTSVYINVVGSMKLLAAYLEGRSKVRPVVQIHDENVALVPQDTSVHHVDTVFEDACGNAYEVAWVGSTKTTLSIPVGEVVFGKNWGDLKSDPIKRTEERIKVIDYV